MLYNRCTGLRCVIPVVCVTNEREESVVNQLVVLIDYTFLPLIRCTGIYKFGNNTYPRCIRRRSNLGHIFREKKCVLWAGKYGIQCKTFLHVYSFFPQCHHMYSQTLWSTCLQ